MKLQIPGCVMRWLGPLILTVIGSVLIFGNPISLDYACRNTGNCVVSWVGALSGWAALAGALLTVGVMREQLVEQRRQTAHLKGDSDPEAFLEPSTRYTDDEVFSEVSITVVNRNRRPLSLHRIEFKADRDVDIGIRSVVMDGIEINQILSRAVKAKFIHRTIPGKEEGMKADRCTVNCHVFVGSQLAVLERDVERWRDIGITVTIHAWLKDSSDKPVELVAKGTISI